MRKNLVEITNSKLTANGFSSSSNGFLFIFCVETQNSEISTLFGLDFAIFGKTTNRKVFFDHKNII